MAMTLISANVEGLTAFKASILSVMCKEKHWPRLQETDRSKDQARPRIPDMAVVAERPHNKHGRSVFFIRDGLKVNSEDENVELITVELPGVVHFMYKPPPTPCIGTKKQASYRNRRFQQPQYTLGIHHNKQRRKICGAMGGLKQPVTRTQRETTNTIQQCNMEYNPYLFWIPSRAHSIALYVWLETRLLCHNPPHPEHVLPEES